MPNVIVDAFSYGVPCIGFVDYPEVNELIRYGENGFLVDRLDSDGLKKAIQHIFSRRVRNSLSQGASAFVRQNFNLEDWKKVGWKSFGVHPESWTIAVI